MKSLPLRKLKPLVCLLLPSYPGYKTPTRAATIRIMDLTARIARFTEREWKGDLDSAQ